MVGWKDLSGTAVLNTDVTAEVTSNGGTNWVMTTLTDTGLTLSGGVYRLLTALATLSSGGTTVQVRLKTTAKSEQFKAVSLMVL